MTQGKPILHTVVLGLWATAAPAMSGDPSALCREAANLASGETGAPLPILSAILIAESGRPSSGGGLDPWPWTLHAEGRGMWFDSAEEALAKLNDLVASGLTNIDVGCFQINLHWHGGDYASPSALLDPMINARHAARFLVELHTSAGDWRVAAGQYHSRDPARAEAYARRLETLHDHGTPQVAARAPISAPTPVAAGGALIDLGRRIPPLLGAMP
jgi:hypothetical protein